MSVQQNYGTILNSIYEYAGNNLNNRLKCDLYTLFGSSEDDDIHKPTDYTKISSLVSDFVGSDLKSTLMQSITEIFNPQRGANCSICYEVLSDPIQLKCGHAVDFDCMKQWCTSATTCPLDRSIIDTSKQVIRRPDWIDTTKVVTLKFKFVADDPRERTLFFSTECSVERVKERVLNGNNSSLMRINADRTKYLMLESGRYLPTTACSRYSLTKSSLSDYGFVTEKEYTVYMITKRCHYNCCDNCFAISKKEGNNNLQQQCADSTL